MFLHYLSSYQSKTYLDYCSVVTKCWEFFFVLRILFIYFICMLMANKKILLI